MGCCCVKVRQATSNSRRRYQADGFDLDLTYISSPHVDDRERPRIIAMGFPAKGVEEVWRNRYDDVWRLFLKRHPREVRHEPQRPSSGRPASGDTPRGTTVKVYNLCIEPQHQYTNPLLWQGQWEAYPMYDHNPTSLDVVVRFCDSVHRHLAGDPRNVVAVHCKAGKGRTGAMVACYMLHALRARGAPEVHMLEGQRGLKAMMQAFEEDAKRCLSRYAVHRTRDGRGVTIASQRRLVQYYARLLAVAWRVRYLAEEQSHPATAPGSSPLVVRGASFHRMASGSNTSWWYPATRCDAVDDDDDDDEHPLGCTPSTMPPDETQGLLRPMASMADMDDQLMDADIDVHNDPYDMSDATAAASTRDLQRGTSRSSLGRSMCTVRSDSGVGGDAEGSAGAASASPYCSVNPLDDPALLAGPEATASPPRRQNAHRRRRRPRAVSKMHSESGGVGGHGLRSSLGVHSALSMTELVDAAVGGSGTDSDDDSASASTGASGERRPACSPLTTAEIEACLRSDRYWGRPVIVNRVVVAGATERNLWFVMHTNTFDLTTPPVFTTQSKPASSTASEEALMGTADSTQHVFHVGCVVRGHVRMTVLRANRTKVFSLWCYPVAEPGRAFYDSRQLDWGVPRRQRNAALTVTMHTDADAQL